MDDLDRLLTELLGNESVIDGETINHNRIVKFTVDHGQHNCLTSEVLTVLGRYDFNVYPMPPDHDNNYWAVEG